MSAEEKTKRAKYSRGKGRRAEYEVRDHLRKLGWEANRVPASGAAQGFKGDVIAYNKDKKLVLEVKNLATNRKIFDLYEEHRLANRDDVLSFACPGLPLLCVTASSSLYAIFDGPEYYQLASNNPLYEKYGTTFEKLGRMQSLLGQADILVLKYDRKGLLFVRYR